MAASMMIAKIVFSGALVFFSGMSMAGILPAGSFDNAACVDCHKNNKLVKAWQVSIHAKNETKADCVSCHGNTHNGVLVKARQDKTCITCHQEKDPVSHSYLTSKHGLILKLEKKEVDWTQALAQANYRVPGCAYCHMHAGEHNVSSGVRDADLLNKDADSIKAVQSAMRNVCQDCHAPRYISRLFENGEQMLEIARMKVREAMSVLLQARKVYSEKELQAAEQQYQKMQVHLKNVYLGVAHQSPDYQWWHGHPALDGDLLRIKGRLSELARIKKISSSENKK